MNRGLSSLQTDILAVLDQWPSFEKATAARPAQRDDWAVPRDIIERLELPKNAVTRASLSRALSRLHKRGLVARAFGQLVSVGRSYRYLKINDPVTQACVIAQPRRTWAAIIGKRPTANRQRYDRRCGKRAVRAEP